MKKDGHLRISYVIEKNKKMCDEIGLMVTKDNVAQLLMGDELKQDQFRFFYDTTKIIYDSALRQEFINMKNSKAPNAKIIEE